MEDMELQALQEQLTEQITSTVVLYAYLVDTDASPVLREKEEDNLVLLGQLYASTLSNYQRAKLVEHIFGAEDEEVIEETI